MAAAWSAKRALVAACLAGVSAFPATGQDAGAEGDAEARRRAEESRLQRIQSEIDELREQLSTTESRTGSVLDALDEIDLTLALFAREAESLRAEQRAVRRRQEAASREAAALERSLRAAEAGLRAMLQELHRAGPTRYLRLVAASSSPAQIAAGRRAIEAMSLGEARRVSDYRAGKEHLEAALRELDRDRQSLDHLALDLLAKDQELRQARQRKEAVLAGLKRAKTSQVTALAELAQVENDIQALLRRLREPAAGEALPSLGFAHLHGLLSWPAPGRVAVPFGNVRHPRFGTQVPHPGVDIGAAPGEEVRAVFDGRVVFSTWFKGYGQMIVIDHGDGYLSIYGQVGELLVAAGDMVHEGDLIARSGEGGSFDAPGLYFEIRHDGKAEDPVPWLRARPAAPGARAHDAPHKSAASPARTVP